jgi:DNA-binding NarL/FixJ family response regulator
VTIRVVVADDHTMVREGLALAMENAGFQVVAQAGDGEAAVALAKELQPDIVLMDLSLPVLSGIAATKRIRDEVPDTAVLVLSMLSDQIGVSLAFDAGANGYLVKDCTTAELVDAVERVVAGEEVRSASIVATPLRGATGDGTGHDAGGTVPQVDGVHGFLSRREVEVLRMMATGMSISDAADHLFISVKTVKNHLSSIYRKLGCHDRSQAVLRAVRMGLIQLD